MIFSLGLETVGYEAHLFYLYTLSTTPLREDKSWVNNIDFAMACPRPNSRLTGRQDVNYHKSALIYPVYHIIMTSQFNPISTSFLIKNQ